MKDDMGDDRPEKGKKVELSCGAAGWCHPVQHLEIFGNAAVGHAASSNRGMAVGAWRPIVG